MDQPLDTLLELDESTVIGDRNHASRDLLAELVFLLDVLPRIRGHLFQAERYARRAIIEIEDLDIDRLAQIDQLGRMTDPAPTTCR